MRHQVISKTLELMNVQLDSGLKSDHKWDIIEAKYIMHVPIRHCLPSEDANLVLDFINQNFTQINRHA